MKALEPIVIGGRPAFSALRSMGAASGGASAGARSSPQPAAASSATARIAAAERRTGLTGRRCIGCAGPPGLRAATLQRRIGARRREHSPDGGRTRERTPAAQRRARRRARAPLRGPDAVRRPARHPDDAARGGGRRRAVGHRRRGAQLGHLDRVRRRDGRDAARRPRPARLPHRAPDRSARHRADAPLPHVGLQLAPRVCGSSAWRACCGWSRSSAGSSPAAACGTPRSWRCS